jgi:hypothetical protein
MEGREGGGMNRMLIFISQTFSAIVDCGFMKESNPTCEFSEEEKKEISNALSTLQTSLVYPFLFYYFRIFYITVSLYHALIHE